MKEIKISLLNIMLLIAVKERERKEEKATLILRDQEAEIECIYYLNLL
jgi:hypothetical protein